MSSQTRSHSLETLRVSFQIPDQRMEYEAKISADLTPKDFNLGDSVYLCDDGSVTNVPNGVGVLLGRALGPGQLADTVNVLTQPFMPPKDAVTRLGDIVRDA